MVTKPRTAVPAPSTDSAYELLRSEARLQDRLAERARLAGEPGVAAIHRYASDTLRMVLLRAYGGAVS